MADPKFPKMENVVAFIKLAIAIYSGVEAISKKTRAGDFLAKMFRRMKGLEGKRIAVIGATASGKNSLIARLRSEMVPTAHAQTRGSETVKKYDIRFPVPGHKPIEFKALKSVNVGGEEDERDRFWGDACREADIVFYLVDINRLIIEREETLKRVREDITWFRIEGLGGRGSILFKQNIKLAIIANKVDFFKEIHKNDIDIDAVASATLALTSEIDAIAKSALGPAISWLTGVYPLSIIDDDLFTLLFSAILADVAEKSDEAGRKGK